MKYEIPRYVLRDPINLMVDDSASEAVASEPESSLVQLVHN
jgi:hypothetical protein